MKNRIWQHGIVWGCLALAASPCWAQFNGDGESGLEIGVGMAESGEDSKIFLHGIPCTIDLKDATLGQVVDQIQKTNAIKREKGPDERNTPPINLLIPNELKTLKVGDITLTNLLPGIILTSISKSTNRAFTIEPVANGSVLILRPVHQQVIVKAIRVPWMQPLAPRDPVPHRLGVYTPNVDNFIPPAETPANTIGVSESPPVPDSKADVIGVRNEAVQEQKEIAQQKMKELQNAITTVFEMHDKVSGRTLPLPMINTQEQLGMIMLVGSPESVQIASEIINATNPANNGEVQQGHFRGPMGMGFGGGMGMPSGRAGEMNGLPMNARPRRGGDGDAKEPTPANSPQSERLPQN